MAKPKPAQKQEKPAPSGAPAPEQAPSKKGASSPLLTQVRARLARGDNRGARALLDENPETALHEDEIAALRARLRFDPGALAAAGGVLAAILFALVAAILLRK